MKWLNALALLLQFLAFWFAAPELLGEGTLKRFEKGLQKLISRLPVIILMLFVLGVALTYSVYGVITGLQASESGVENSQMIQYFIFIALSFCAYIVFLVFYKRIIKRLDQHLAQPLLQRLIYKSEMRKNALIVGALLFTIGFIIQFILVLL